MRAYPAAIYSLFCIFTFLSGCTETPPVVSRSGDNEQSSATAPNLDGRPAEVSAAEAVAEVPVSTPATDVTPVAESPISPESAKLEVRATSPKVSESMTRKEMLNLVCSGVVLITAFDARGETSAFGSGCIVGDNLVLTNYHVAASALTLKVQVKGEGDELLSKEMKVTGYRALDERNDLILLEVVDLPSGLYTFPVPDTETIEQHDQVFSVGHPDGFKFSTSPGFVSAILKTRDMPEQFQAVLKNPDTEWIQTDAVISGGSSGGPLLDERGQLVGVTTLVISDSRIAFAVSAKHVRDLLSQRDQPVLPLPTPDADVLTTKTLAGVMESFRREYLQLVADVQQLRSTTQDPAEVRKLVRRNNPGPACLRRCTELADQYPGAAEAADALKVSADVLKALGSIPDDGRQYLDDMLARAADDPSLIPLSPRVLNSLFGLKYSAALETFLRRIIDSDEENKLKSAAGIVLVNAMSLSGNPLLDGEMNELAKDISVRFGDEKFGTLLVSDILKPVLDAQKLAIGSTAPEITGTDLLGETFRLTDYRGKVVMLDFWADWCPHCRNMYAEERELIEKLKDKPFVLLGVNGDEPARAKGVIEAGTVTWRSWMDGSAGPIAELYQVQAWPSILVLDTTGRIRFSGLRGPALESAIESLLNDSQQICPEEIIAKTASWQYLNPDETTVPADWNTTDFDDSTWQSGSGPFAAADLDESGTILAQSPAGRRPITTLFRTKFDLQGGESPESLLMNIQFRDGVTVSLNGEEIYRGNVSASGEIIIKSAYRDSGRGASGIAFAVSTSGLRPVGNCLAVSLHQYSAYSASPLFSLSLGAMPNYSERFGDLPPQGKQQLCRVVAQAGLEVPGAKEILKSLQADNSGDVRISAAIAAAMNELPVTMSSLTDPESQQSFFTQVFGLNHEAWQIVESPGFSTGQYTDALRMARAASVLQSRVNRELRPALGVIENTVGVAFYRSGQFEQAVERLKRSMKTVGDNPSDAGFLALCHHKLGHVEESKKYEELFHELLKKDEWRHNAAAFKVDKELQTVLSE